MNNRLSICTMLNLIEQMSYDDKKELINGLQKPIYKFNSFTTRAKNKEEAIEIIIKDNEILKSIKIYQIHDMLFCRSQQCYLEMEDYICINCREEIKCFICNEELKHDHFLLHDIDEIDKDIMRKYLLNKDIEIVLK